MWDHFVAGSPDENPNGVEPKMERRSVHNTELAPPLRFIMRRVDTPSKNRSVRP